MGNAKLYRKLLTKFRDSQGNFAELFAAARSDADASAVTRAAHTLKGTAGNIGAKGIQAAAAELERACKENQSQEIIDELLKKTLAELHPVIEQLKQFDHGGTPEITTSDDAFNSAKVKELLEKLRKLLEDSDSEAVNALEELETLVKGTSMAENLRKVANAVAEYDFDTAVEHLPEMSES